MSLSPSHFLNSMDLLSATTINVSGLRHLNYLNLFTYFNNCCDDHSIDLIVATRLSSNWPWLSSNFSFYHLSFGIEEYFLFLILQVSRLLYFILFYSCCYSCFFLRLPLFFYTTFSKCSFLINTELTLYFCNLFPYSHQFFRKMVFFSSWERKKVYQILCHRIMGIASIPSCKICFFPVFQSTIKTVPHL